MCSKVLSIWWRLLMAISYGLELGMPPCYIIRITVGSKNGPHSRPRPILLIFLFFLPGDQAVINACQVFTLMWPSFQIAFGDIVNNINLSYYLRVKTPYFWNWHLSSQFAFCFPVVVSCKYEYASLGTSILKENL